MKTEKTLRKREELLKYLQSTNPSYGKITKITAKMNGGRNKLVLQGLLRVKQLIQN